MADLTAGGSKEALRLGGRTVLDYVLDEAFDAAVSHVVIVSNQTKTDIADIMARRRESIELCFQSAPLGLAHALVCAGHDEEDALVLLPDTLYGSAEPAKTLIAAREGFDGAILCQSVTEAEVHQYGIVEATAGSISSILEKPQPEATISRLAVAARYVLSAKLMGVLREFMLQPSSGEYDLTSALNIALSRGHSMATCETAAHRYDCGSPEGYRQALEVFGA